MKNQADAGFAPLVEAGGESEGSGVVTGLKLLLLVHLAAYAVALYLDISHYGIWARDPSGHRISPDVVEHYENCIAILENIDNRLFLFISVLFLVWVYRASEAASRMKDGKMRFSPAWAIGWYWVPVACLWKPYQVMSEIWDASRRAAGGGEDDCRFVLKCWWGSWIATICVSLVLLIVLSDSRLSEDVHVIFPVSIGLELLKIFLLLTTLLLVFKITEFQTVGRKARGQAWSRRWTTSPSFSAGR